MIENNVLISAVVIFVIVITVILAILEPYLKRIRKPLHTSTSILISYYTENRSLVQITKRVLDDGSGNIVFSLGTNLSMSVVYLSFTTQIRLLGIPTSEAVQLNPSRGNSIMDRLELEGDFSGFFNLYSSDNEGFKARYILDPAAMAFVIDMCKRYNWEIINNELIFVSKEVISKDEIQEFIRQIRPAIEVSGDSVDKNIRNEYINSFFAKLNCPICNNPTSNNGNERVCPLGHGKLISGKELSNIPRKNLVLESADNNTVKIINCPNCKNEMVKLKYGKTVIDSCISCPYRWLDNGELGQ